MNIVWIITRDQRLYDNNVLLSAINRCNQVGGKIIPVFILNPIQISKENELYNSKAIQFLIESLIELEKEIPITYFYQMNIRDVSTYLTSQNIKEIFIMKDYTPFSQSRISDLSSSGLVVNQVDDITLYPSGTFPIFKKLSPFITNIISKGIPPPNNMQINKNIFLGYNRRISFNNIINGGISQWWNELLPIPNNGQHIHAGDLSILLQKLKGNIEGYSKDSNRKNVGYPKVSRLSAFLKFGLLSIRQIHDIVNKLDINKEDKEAFTRELLFRDFYYNMAYHDVDGVYYLPNWQEQIKGSRPRFIRIEHLQEWKKISGDNTPITQDDMNDIEKARGIVDKWMKGETEYTIVNAGINELIKTGYMLNRARMICASYLYRDNNIWWKYGEWFYAMNLIDYDWTINALNHQNIAKVGLYPKYTQDFSLSTQDKGNGVSVYYDKYSH
ncbi:Deoxyribodipyrimidine photo-lyase [Orpheovirus IHUMI-LCC2]|uniref:Deoxyribodipyrimidine photo-lyase n=1 Tax=Orpheovirus IHUMI-LCC2 TaxID=2023057 RepID=A0A2I2L3H0_9VIRU|nr:Deoxyribodipyrimidine photo-lyase [Orpheovirus IHUMI-LCC2]SNW62019.1 Deoxyribodipyrimidine photo-lyase [Orpheovirus IHUMI-LCC2]